MGRGTKSKKITKTHQQTVKLYILTFSHKPNFDPDLKVGPFIGWSQFPQKVGGEEELLNWRMCCVLRDGSILTANDLVKKMNEQFWTIYTLKHVKETALCGSIWKTKETPERYALKTDSTLFQESILRLTREILSEMKRPSMSLEDLSNTLKMDLSSQQLRDLLMDDILLQVNEETIQFSTELQRTNEEQRAEDERLNQQFQSVRKEILEGMTGRYIETVIHNIQEYAAIHQNQERLSKEIQVSAPAGSKLTEGQKKEEILKLEKLPGNTRKLISMQRERIQNLESLIKSQEPPVEHEFEAKITELGGGSMEGVMRYIQETDDAIKNEEWCHTMYSLLSTRLPELRELVERGHSFWKIRLFLIDTGPTSLEEGDILTPLPSHLSHFRFGGSIRTLVKSLYNPSTRPFLDYMGIRTTTPQSISEAILVLHGSHRQNLKERCMGDDVLEHLRFLETYHSRIEDISLESIRHHLWIPTSSGAYRRPWDVYIPTPQLQQLFLLCYDSPLLYPVMMLHSQWDPISATELSFLTSIGLSVSLKVVHQSGIGSALSAEFKHILSHAHVPQVRDLIWAILDHGFQYYREVEQNLVVRELLGAVQLPITGAGKSSHEVYDIPSLAAFHPYLPLLDRTRVEFKDENLLKRFHVQKILDSNLLDDIHSSMERDRCTDLKMYRNLYRLYDQLGVKCKRVYTPNRGISVDITLTFWKGTSSVSRADVLEPHYPSLCAYFTEKCRVPLVASTFDHYLTLLNGLSLQELSQEEKKNNYQQIYLDMDRLLTDDSSSEWYVLDTDWNSYMDLYNSKMKGPIKFLNDLIVPCKRLIGFCGIKKISEMTTVIQSQDQTRQFSLTLTKDIRAAICILIEKATGQDELQMDQLRRSASRLNVYMTSTPVEIRYNIAGRLIQSTVEQSWDQSTHTLVLHKKETYELEHIIRCIYPTIQVELKLTDSTLKRYAREVVPPQQKTSEEEDGWESLKPQKKPNRVQQETSRNQKMHRGTPQTSTKKSNEGSHTKSGTSRYELPDWKKKENNTETGRKAEYYMYQTLSKLLEGSVCIDRPTTSYESRKMQFNESNWVTAASRHYFPQKHEADLKESSGYDFFLDDQEGTLSGQPRRILMEVKGHKTQASRSFFFTRNEYETGKWSEGSSDLYLVVGVVLSPSPHIAYCVTSSMIHNDLSVSPLAYEVTGYPIMKQQDNFSLSNILGMGSGREKKRSTTSEPQQKSQKKSRIE
ncbi:hypothetical protein PROFUN_10426 [Planoprotostelium fungivorum]|uniref:Protein NO VEIN C-terminal domain-containing protein n=1 Tax=Planoprotostelium fungivorum TaxID=1890364 RepID=A0A2P6NDZ6_9EUKA|nr:hypothetical protein PROFUN_10426 [Planoprotostelium fungivorum]